MVAPDNPVLGRRWRGDGIETIHRGCWAVVSASGEVLAAAGDPEQPVFARSSSKSLQGLALVDSGAIERFGLTGPQLAVSVASHNGEPMHVDVVRSILEAAGLDESHLKCGAASPIDRPDVEPLAVRHNCSGKHAGFLAATVARGEDPTEYIDPSSPFQRRVRELVVEITGTADHEISLAIDGCSAPTFRLPLRALARGIAAVAGPHSQRPEVEQACRRIVAAVAAHPEMVAGRAPQRFDTAVVEATAGRLFSKGGAEGVQVIGVVGAGVAIVAKIDDGSTRALWPVAIEVLRSMGHIGDDEIEPLAPFVDPIITNAAGLEVGRQEIDPAGITW